MISEKAITAQTTRLIGAHGQRAPATKNNAIIAAKLCHLGIHDYSSSRCKWQPSSASLSTSRASAKAACDRSPDGSIEPSSARKSSSSQSSHASSGSPSDSPGNRTQILDRCAIRRPERECRGESTVLLSRVCRTSCRRVLRYVVYRLALRSSQDVLVHFA